VDISKDNVQNVSKRVNTLLHFDSLDMKILSRSTDNLNKLGNNGFFHRHLTGERALRISQSCWTAPLPHSLLNNSLGKGEYFYGWYLTSRGKMQGHQG
jgi:hypothetical protein